MIPARPADLATAERRHGPSSVAHPQRSLTIRRLVSPRRRPSARPADQRRQLWLAPSVPVRLYAARADRDSVIANAWHCQAALRAHGANIPVIDVGPVDHVSSLVLAALPKLLAWFQHPD